MIDQCEIAYNLKREVKERAAEAAATDPGARESHRKMADRYADVTWALESDGAKTAIPVDPAVATAMMWLFAYKGGQHSRV